MAGRGAAARFHHNTNAEHTYEGENCHINAERAYEVYLCMYVYIYVICVNRVLNTIARGVHCNNLQVVAKTLPKAQRTRGLSSYHKFKHKS